MFKVTRPNHDILIVSEKPLAALVRLGIWLGVVGIFYAVVLGWESGATIPAPTTVIGHGWREGLILLFPVFLLPYLFSCVRGILGAGDLVFDGTSRTVTRKQQSLAAFSDIRELNLRTVNATCEEYSLSALLADGRKLSLLEIKGSPDVEQLAEEIAALIGVEITRAA